MARRARHAARELPRAVRVPLVEDRVDRLLGHLQPEQRHRLASWLDQTDGRIRELLAPVLRSRPAVKKLVGKDGDKADGKDEDNEDL